MASALFDIDYHSAFFPTVSIVEIILRGTIMYLGIFTILRFVLKREAARRRRAECHGQRIQVGA